MGSERRLHKHKYGSMTSTTSSKKRVWGDCSGSLSPFITSTGALLWHFSMIVQSDILHFSAKGGWLCLSLLPWPLQVPVLSRKISLGWTKMPAGSPGEGAVAGEEKGRLRTYACTYPTDYPKTGLPGAWPHPGTPMHCSEPQHWLCHSCSSHLSTISSHKVICRALCLWY